MNATKEYNLSDSKKKALTNLFMNELKDFTVQKEYE